MSLLPIFFKLPSSVDNLVGVTGEFGSGKTLFMLELAFHLCELYHKNLVVNFPINLNAAKHYCQVRDYKWFFTNGRVICVDLAIQGLSEVFKRKGTVVVFDEGGVLINARNWSKHGMDVLSPLFQVRHDDIHLIVGFQFVDQVDVQLRKCFQMWVVCGSLRRRDNKLRGPRIFGRSIYFYDRRQFEKLQDDVQAKANLVRPWLASKYVAFSFLPVKWFALECRNFVNAIYLYLRYAKSPNKIRSKFKQLKTTESLLFDSYQSIGSRIGEVTTDSNSRRLSKVILVTEGLQKHASFRKSKTDSEYNGLPEDKLW